MYRQIYRDKILYYVATQRFNSPKSPVKKPQSSDTPTLPRGYPPFCQKGLLLLPSITNTLEWIGSITIQ
jgi:hypothetical protein